MLIAGHLTLPRLETLCDLLRHRQYATMTNRSALRTPTGSNQSEHGAPEMAKKDIITAEFVRSILDYNPETGSLIWKARVPDMFAPNKRGSQEWECNRWNSRYASKDAGKPDAKGYLRLSIHRKFYQGSRIIWLWMTGEWPKEFIDHVNIDPADNSWINLREASRSQNGANRHIPKANTTGLKGVHWMKANRKWLAQIRVKKRQFYLGLFDCPAAAHFAYLVETDNHFGNFGRHM